MEFNRLNVLKIIKRNLGKNPNGSFDRTGISFEATEEDKVLLKGKSNSEIEVYSAKKILESEKFQEIIKEINDKFSLEIDTLLEQLEIIVYSDFCGHYIFGDVSVNEIFDSLLKKSNIKEVKEKIYRLEIDDSGFYQNDKKEQLEKLFQSDKEDNPLPHNEKDINKIFVKLNRDEHFDDYSSNWFFGFKNKDSLLKWCNAMDFNEMKNQGIKVSEYLVDSSYCINGDNQSIFKKDESIKIKESFIMDYLNEKTKIKKPKRRKP
jgi:hypothetical protein